MIFYKYGGKQLYYNNTYDGQGEIDVDRDTANSVEGSEGVAEENYEEDCDSCKI